MPQVVAAGSAVEQGRQQGCGFQDRGGKNEGTEQEPSKKTSVDCKICAIVVRKNWLNAEQKRERNHGEKLIKKAPRLRVHLVPVAVPSSSTSAYGPPKLGPMACCGGAAGPGISVTDGELAGATLVDSHCHLSPPASVVPRFSPWPRTRRTGQPGRMNTTTRPALRWCTGLVCTPGGPTRSRAAGSNGCGRP